MSHPDDMPFSELPSPSWRDGAAVGNRPHRRHDLAAFFSDMGTDHQFVVLHELADTVWINSFRPVALFKVG